MAGKIPWYLKENASEIGAWRQRMQRRIDSEVRKLTTAQREDWLNWRAFRFADEVDLETELEYVRHFRKTRQS